MTDAEAKAMHLKDAKKALKELQTDARVSEDDKEYRSLCLNEFITMIETGKTDHINIDIK